MHDIIEHYGKVVIALAGVLAAVLLTAAVVTIVTDRTKADCASPAVAPQGASRRHLQNFAQASRAEIGRASCRERV